MPNYVVSTPDNRKLKVSAPEGTGLDKVLSFVRDTLSNSPAAQAVSGALNNPLGNIFSAADTAKRYLSDFAADPVGKVQQAIGQLSDDAKSGKLQGDLMGFAPGGMDAGLVGQTVWHGSPHLFDKFDMSKIGTGEGAQAFGHGLYVAESPAVAKEYADKLSTMRTTVNGVPVTPKDPHFEAAMHIASSGYDQALANVQSGAQFATPDGKALLGKLAGQIQSLKGAQIEQAPISGMYQADIPDEAVSRMLDWDKPLSEQHPDVQAALQPLLGKLQAAKSGGTIDYYRPPVPVAERHGGMTYPDLHLVNYKYPDGTFTFGVGGSKDAAIADATGKYNADIPASQFYNELARTLDGSPGQIWGRGSGAASDALATAGIPGIKYLDGGSRNIPQDWTLTHPQGGQQTFPTESMARSFMAKFPNEGYAITPPASPSSNYVLFNDQMPRILAVNGQPTGQQPWAPGEWQRAGSVTPDNINSVTPAMNPVSEMAQSNNLPYQFDHKPMQGASGSATLDDLSPAFGEDIYGKNALQYFGSGDPREAQVLKTMASVRGKPDAPVTIYRGVPDDVQQVINPGDWVTLHPDVAADYGNVVSKQVPASHVTGWADSLLENGYFPPTE